jgi:hypothetical protein
MPAVREEMPGGEIGASGERGDALKWCDNVQPD